MVNKFNDAKINAQQFPQQLGLLCKSKLSFARGDGVFRHNVYNRIYGY